MADSELPALGFLDLPAKIRIEIYQHLFRSALIVVSATQLVAPPIPSIICSGGFQRHALSTCWTTGNEAHSYLMAATALQIRQPLDDAVPIPPYYLEDIPRLVVSDAKAFLRQPFKPDRLPGLRMLELHITIWCKYHSESFFLEGERSGHVMYDLALYNIHRISPALTKMIDEEQRGYKVWLFCQFVVSSAFHDTINALIDVDDQSILHKERGPKIGHRNAWAGYY